MFNPIWYVLRFGTVLWSTPLSNAEFDVPELTSGSKPVYLVAVIRLRPVNTSCSLLNPFIFTNLAASNAMARLRSLKKEASS